MTRARVSGRLALGVIVACIAVLAARPAGADAYRSVGPDGTVHYTNTPTDRTFQRIGLSASPVLTGAQTDGASWRAFGGGRKAAFAPIIRDAAARYNVPESLVHAVIRVESGFNPVAVSPKGAQGLMQLMPQTASLLGVRDSFDPTENIDGGVRHLRRLIDRFGHDLELALAAYNAGEHAVTQYGGIPPYRETQGYVEKVLALYRGAAASDPDARPATPQVVYRLEDSDGTPVYTNIPPPGVRAATRRR